MPFKMSWHGISLIVKYFSAKNILALKLIASKCLFPNYKVFVIQLRNHFKTFRICPHYHSQLLLEEFE